MAKPTILGAMLAAAAMAGAACTTHQQSTPPLSGPSELALALSVTATPDLLALDGSQSAIVVQAKGPNGEARVGLPLRLDIAVGNTVQDCGQLSSRNVITGQDGRAVSVFTAPSLPLPFPNCLNFAPGGSVTIIATPTGNDSLNAVPRIASIQMVPPGNVTIVPPAPTPVAAFTFTPLAPTAGAPVIFSASTSCGGPLVGGACTSISQIVSYAWSFGDGSSATVSTPTTTHTFVSQQVFAVTLTVTNDRGVSTSVTQSVALGAPAVPTTANFVFSPNPAAINQPVVFDASTTVVAPGITITDYAWVFGDGTGILHTTNKTLSHVYATAGVFAVTLTVTDNIGSHSASTVKTTTVTVNGGAAPPAVPTAVFTVSQSPAQTAVALTVDGTQSTPSAGSAIVRYEWDFGDGTGIVGGASATATHTYGAAGSYIILLTVTDATGKQASTSRVIVVQ
jgi:PKD repeat protein